MVRSPYRGKDCPVELPFAGRHSPIDLESRRLDPRSAYHYLVNVDEYPEVLSFAQQVVLDRIQSIKELSGKLPAEFLSFAGTPDSLPHALDCLRHLAATTPKPWDSSDGVDAGARLEHFLKQYTPAALVEGCWLQGALKVPICQTEVGARLTQLYAHILDIPP